MSARLPNRKRLASQPSRPKWNFTVMDANEILKAKLQNALSECQRLRDENAQLRRRLQPPETTPRPRPTPTPWLSNDRTSSSAPVTNASSPEAKIALFRNLFRGREDVYAIRWEGKGGKTGYAPAGVREWDQSQTTRQKKGSFHYTKLFPISDEVIRDHLLGRQTVGVYPLTQDDTCWFVAVDFDKKSWEADACAFLRTCHDFAVPAALERSRSGNGGHVWIFFANPIQAAVARKLASAVLTRTMERRYAVGLDSYDRLFPSQDTMPKGGFGNLIALPLQHGPREEANSVFLDDRLCPYKDQWAFLSTIKRLDQNDIQAILRKTYPCGDVINVKYSASEYGDNSDPWILPPSGQLLGRDITEPLPETVSIALWKSNLHREAGIA